MMQNSAVLGAEQCGARCRTVRAMVANSGSESTLGEERHADLEEVCAALSDHAPRTLDSICKHPDEA